jgi:hypothetical protein
VVERQQLQFRQQRRQTLQSLRISLGAIDPGIQFGDGYCGDRQPTGMLNKTVEYPAVPFQLGRADIGIQKEIH